MEPGSSTGAAPPVARKRAKVILLKVVLPSFVSRARLLVKAESFLKSGYFQVRRPPPGDWIKRGPESSNHSQEGHQSRKSQPAWPAVGASPWPIVICACWHDLPVGAVCLRQYDDGIVRLLALRSAPLGNASSGHRPAEEGVGCRWLCVELGSSPREKVMSLIASAHSVGRPAR